MAFCALWGLTNVRLTTNLAPCHSTRAIFYRLCLLLTEIETSENGGKGALPPHTISTPTTFQSDYNKSWWRDIWLQRTSLCGDLIRREWSNPPFFICSSLSAPQGCKTASDFCPPFLSDVMDLQQPQPGARTQTDQLSRGGKMAESEESVGGREVERTHRPWLYTYEYFLKRRLFSEIFRNWSGHTSLSGFLAQWQMWACVLISEDFSLYGDKFYVLLLRDECFKQKYYSVVTGNYSAII